MADIEGVLHLCFAVVGCTGTLNGNGITRLQAEAIPNVTIVAINQAVNIYGAGCVGQVEVAIVLFDATTDSTGELINGCILCCCQELGNGSFHNITRLLGLLGLGSGATSLATKSLLGEFHTKEDSASCVVGSSCTVKCCIGRELNSVVGIQTSEFHRVVVVLGRGEVVVGVIILCTCVSLDSLRHNLATIHAEVDGLVATCTPRYCVEVQIEVTRNANGCRGEFTLLLALTEFETSHSTAVDGGCTEAISCICAIVGRAYECCVRSVGTLCHGRFGGITTLAINVRDVESVHNLVFRGAIAALVEVVFTLNGDSVASVQTFGTPIYVCASRINKTVDIDRASFIHEVEVAILGIDVTADNTSELVGSSGVCFFNELCNANLLCVGVKLGATLVATTCVLDGDTLREVKLCASATSNNHKVVQAVCRSNGCGEVERKGCGNLSEGELCGRGVPTALGSTCKGVGEESPFLAIAADINLELLGAEIAVAILLILVACESNGESIAGELGERNTADGEVVLLAEEYVVQTTCLCDIGVVAIAIGVVTSGNTVRVVGNTGLALGHRIAILGSQIGPAIATLNSNGLVEVVEVDELARGGEATTLVATGTNLATLCEVNLYATTTCGEFDVVDSVCRTNTCGEVERESLGNLFEVELRGCDVPFTIEVYAREEGVANLAPFCAIGTDINLELVVLVGVVLCLILVALGSERESECVALQLCKRDAAYGHIGGGATKPNVVQARSNIRAVGVATCRAIRRVAAYRYALTSVCYVCLTLGSGVEECLTSLAVEVGAPPIVNFLCLLAILIEVLVVENLAKLYLTFTRL